MASSGVIKLFVALCHLDLAYLNEAALIADERALSPERLHLSKDFHAAKEFLVKLPSVKDTGSDDTSDATYGDSAASPVADPEDTPAATACESQTKVCTADYQSADGAAMFECKEVVYGARQDMPPAQSQNGAMVCGPGTFYFSPFPCDTAKDEDYLKTALIVQDNTWHDGALCPDNGTRISFPYSMACYFAKC